MKHFNSLIRLLTFSLFLITGCKKDLINENALVPPGQLESKTAARQSLLQSAEVKAKLQKLRKSLPTGYEKRLKQNSPLLSKLHPEYRQMVLRVSKVIEPAPCNDNTPLYQWLNKEIADWDDDVFFFAIITGMLDFPFFDALLFENSSANQYFGVNGENTQQVTKTFKDLKRFWNIQSNGIVLGAMHGRMLTNREKLIRIDKIIYGDSQEAAEFWADLILSLLKDVPQYRNGDHPIFTFNAVASSAFDFPPYGIVPDKIIMGDGIMQGYAAIGYGDVAPQAILAHEYGHHIQFQLRLFDNTQPGPEFQRKIELMADAYSAYYLSHSRGAAMQWKRVRLFLQVFFNIGDCAITSPGHHGTPAQRMAAADWAYSVANNAQKQGHILTSQQFTKLFEAQLPTLVKK